MDKDGLQCKSCYEYQKVDEHTKAITCSRCTMINTLKLKPMDEFFQNKKYQPKQSTYLVEIL